MNTLGKTALRLREQRELTREQLAEKTDVPYYWIRQLEQGKLPQAEHHLAQMRSLAAALGYSFACFLREAGVIEADTEPLSGDPGLRELVANYSQLNPEEREAVDTLLRSLAKKGK